MRSLARKLAAIGLIFGLTLPSTVSAQDLLNSLTVEGEDRLGTPQPWDGSHLDTSPNTHFNEGAADNGANGVLGPESGDGTPVKPEDGVSIVQPAASPVEGALSCKPGEFYGLTTDTGELYKATISGKEITTQSVPGKFSEQRVEQTNGLAIGYHGTFAYAYDKRSSGSDPYVDLRIWTPQNGFSEVKQIRLDSVRKTDFGVANLVAGAAKLELGNRDFYFGGYSNEVEGVKKKYFNLWKYTEKSQSTQYLGYINTEKESNSGTRANGDLAFNDNGDMYLLLNDGKNSQVFTVSAEDLARAENNVGTDSEDFHTNEHTELKAQNGGTLATVSGKTLNGFALNSDGTLLVASADSLYQIDPNVEEIVARGELSEFLSGDLASCQNPPTLELKKKVNNRAKPSDQFNLSITRVSDDGNVVTGEVDTKGDQVGEQSDKVGPLPVRSGRTYILREGKPGSNSHGKETDIHDYSASLTCVNEEDSSNIALDKINEYEYSLKIPEIASSVNHLAISCTFENSVRVGAVKWKKVGKHGVLAGAGWKIYQENGPIYFIKDNEISISPNVKLGKAMPVDEDKLLGQYDISGLPVGEWILEENLVPSGYKNEKKTIKHNFVISKDNPKVDLGTITNYKSALSWRKVDSSTRDVIESGKDSASSWLVEFKDKKIIVRDCIEDSPEKCQDQLDTDSRAGEFRLEGMDERPLSERVLFDGKYLISENTPPEGYMGNARMEVDIEGNHISTRILDSQGQRQNLDQEFKFDKDTKYALADLGDISNDKAVANIFWKKADSRDQMRLLGGSKWRLLSEGKADIEIEDCVSGDCKELLDKDPNRGAFKIENIGLGTYTLIETNAPEGYALGDVPVSKELVLSKEHVHKGFDLGTISNQVVQGSVTWEKAHAGDPTALLDGSEWSLEKIDGRVEGVEESEQKYSVTIKDCSSDGSNCAKPDDSSLVDASNEKGKFRVDGLTAGKYRLVESKAPLQFKLNTTPFEFEIRSNGEVVSVGRKVMDSESRTEKILPIENEPKNGIKLPLTGGMGSDIFRMAGGVLGMIALIAGAWYVIRRRA
ncbi:SpaA isopeptide-forming pilin-related protein [Corynebacterium diphtheriae]|uniref:SpaA isopeptide-forming pilin-related protein n=1 Tax=Corynebacterium diphtheriae TaxID=1717 RepID=UPI0013C76532|nr:SpaA isopeptide-forming pilin-related protein [Corynebacterium diphtheriae]MBG9277388.1 fimbrial assembly protein [Corynebacterium diphtheriae bv. mitis]MBG9281703.1 fimbrial assembly protein [Corynebacterium diphtheriae bv. mitis]CAB0585685.1 surface-anchored fimbrial subunit [Corynebacterium diphtheriae]CAB0806203.1 surface-anchored fimbrial subunit [Corynebacterium diphtheriae]CAB0830962.1 surface-anchored fimbrial subunit [Corynebacterium diphtheriae]